MSRPAQRDDAAGARPPRRPTAADGFVVVDKPAGWTSHDVVGRVRRLAGTRKVGHAGTLDPMATGVLVVGVGRATRLLTYVVGADKAYDATIRLGVGTTTDDAEGEPTATPGYLPSDVTRPPSDAPAASSPAESQDPVGDEIRAAVADLTGDILQVPTSVSAIKVDGRRAYARVRAGEEVELKARPVTVSEFTVHAARRAEADGVPVLDLDVTVVVSSGTYVRALARDLGAALGTAGHLTALRRTRVGGHTLDQARTLEAMEAQADADGTLATIPMAQAAAADLPVRELTDDETRDLGFGRWVAPSGQQGTVAAVAPDGALVALLEDTRRQGQPWAKPVLVLAPAV
ncbi:tRNA pseudouridine synthase B [Xylanimonas protaetiae]|uniref:tRNA pseudouridine synthase B n=1 Tax=Xylanimonas protaetiae TaxID=2509457 RepID=A0A4P6F4Q6_9MICO|nr:tRNA pseudouridine(55) synthase TruB [Xylanimonas protaetiae]QAY70574.1 tRNA pseudouridine(55) synthase TruB [Xylanimonas protaetiae]